MDVTLDTGTLWHRGNTIPYARVITPDLTWEEWTVDRIDEGLAVSWHANPVPALTLTDLSVSDDLRAGWRVEGTNPDGERVVWRIVRVSCGCHHSGPHPTNRDELPLPLDPY